MEPTSESPKYKTGGPKGVEYKMGGPKGVVMFSLFFTVYTFYITAKCQFGSWSVFALPRLPSGGISSLGDTYITGLVLLWFLLQCMLYVMPLGGMLVQGVKLESGIQLMYRTNAQFVLLTNLALLLTAALFGYDVTFVTQHLLQFYVSALALCTIFGVFLYLRGVKAKLEARNAHGQTGNTVYDWFMGRELNPRFGSLDLKYVMFRSSIIAWMVLNVCSVLESWQQRGTVSSTLALLTVVQLTYVVDYFWYESGVIVSRDIVHEGLGFNILFQFLMIPFCFYVQTRYILTMDCNLSLTSLTAATFLYAIGYYIYRASNSEKNDFRKNPDDPKLAYLKTMSTSSGRKLLISGWWGMCRHPNYLGDLLISLSYAIFTGFTHVIPYMGTVFLVLLLLDRERQDNAVCQRKYGKDWEKYCTIVRYRIIPAILSNMTDVCIICNNNTGQPMSTLREKECQSINSTSRNNGDSISAELGKQVHLESRKWY